VVAYGWKPDFLGNEIGPLSALAVDGNAYRDDAPFLRDPAIHNARLFAAYLRAVGVSVPAAVVRQGRPASAPVLVTRPGPALAAVVRSTLENSRNFVAELLLKELGRQVRGPGRGTTLDGLAAVRALLPGVAVGQGGDGSGLSSLNRQTPNAQLQLLRLASTGPVSTAFVQALPIACLEGTLERRMCGTAAGLRATAKTGTLQETRALTGFTRTASGRLVQFSFQLQGIGSGRQATDAMDRAVAVLSAAAG